MKTTLTFATAIGACLLLGACNKQSSDKTAVQGGESAVAESAKSARINANLRFEADVNLNLAPLLSGVSNGAFNPLDDVANKTINPPVHARGAINSLKLDGKDVLLASKELKEGFLFTKVFGELEVFVTGIRGGQAVLE